MCMVIVGVGIGMSQLYCHIHGCAVHKILAAVSCLSNTVALFSGYFALCHSHHIHIMVNVLFTTHKGP